MDGQGSSSQFVATQHRADRRDERPLPPYPGTSQHTDGEIHVDPRDAALYERLVTGAQGGVNDSSREYERWREPGYQGSPRSYSRGEGELNTSSSSLPGQTVSTPGQVSRSRGSSASQRIGEKRAQASEAVNEMRANRPFRIDGPSNPRRTSSLTSARGSTSSMSAHQSDGSSSGGDTPLLSHTSPSQNRRRRVAETTEVVVPRWQPDVEVTFCPICRTQFSFFVRKHHCRKCGRVVCNSCSPHRITIPYQYIVQPPIEGVSMGPQSGFPRPSIDAARAGSSREVASLGGGERVRLCNPCVPDPNVAPPQPSLNDPPQLFPSPNRSSRSASAASYYSQFQQQHGTSRPTSNVEAFNEAIRSAPRRPRESSLLGPANPQYASYRDQTLSSRGLEAYDTRSRSSTVSGTSRDTGNMVGPSLFCFNARGNGQGTMMPARTQAPAGPGQSPNSEGRAVVPAPSYPRSMNHATPQRPHPSPQRPPAPVPQPSAPQPRPQIADDDMCWICREELPARNLPNFQNLRDQHVNSCVARETSRAAGTQAAPGPAASSAQRRNGQLFPYTATEKDCVDDAECTICLEDFEVGVEMGRLECFCRYHKKCIREWWEKKPGECPVHHAPT